MIGSLPDGWQYSEAADKAKRRIQSLILNCINENNTFIITAQSICRIMPIWIDMLRQTNIEPMFIHYLRHPWEISQSLSENENMDLDKAHLLWLAHTLDSVKICNRWPHVIITFDQFLSDPVRSIQRINSQLNISYSKELKEIYSELIQFVQPELNKYKADELPNKEKVRFEVFRNFYSKILNFRRKPSFGYAQNNLLLKMGNELKYTELKKNTILPILQFNDFNDDILNTMYRVIGHYENNERKSQIGINRFTVKEKNGRHYFARIGIVSKEQVEFNLEKIPLPVDQWFKITVPLKSKNTLKEKQLLFIPLNTTGIVKISDLNFKNMVTGKSLWSAKTVQDFDTFDIINDVVRLPDKENLLLLVTGNLPQIRLILIEEIFDVPLEVEIWIKIFKKQDTLNKIRNSLSIPYIILRLIGIDKLSKNIFVSGLYSGLKNNFMVTLTCGSNVSTLKIKRGKKYWDIALPLQNDALSNHKAELLFHEGNTVFQKLSFFLMDAIDLTRPSICFSQIIPDPIKREIYFSGWYYHPDDISDVIVSIKGMNNVVHAKFGIIRSDVKRKHPLIHRSDVGWKTTISFPTPDFEENLIGLNTPEVEVSLFAQGRLVAHSKQNVIFKGDLEKTMKQRELLKKITPEKVKNTSILLLYSLLCSDAFRRRWAVKDNYVCQEVRRLLVKELIARNAVNKNIAIRLENGDLVVSNPMRDHVMARAFLLKGMYESGFVSLCESLVKHGDLAIDVGAAYGVITRCMARKGAKVYAVEANRNMAYSISKSLKMNNINSVIVIQRAIYNRPGTIKFGSLKKVNIGGSKIVDGNTIKSKIKLVEEINDLSIIPLKYEINGKKTKRQFML